MGNMQLTLFLTFFAGLTLMSGCSGDSQQAAFFDACTSSTNMGVEICECTAELARERLTDDGMAFVVASMLGDSERAQVLAGQLTVEEATQAGLFLVSGPAECAAQR